MQMIFSAVGDFCMQSARTNFFFRRVALQPVGVLDYDRTAAPLLCPRCWTPSSLLVPNRCQRHRHRWQVGVASWRPLRSHSNTTVLVRLQKYFRSPTRSLPSHSYPTMTMDDLQKKTWPFRYLIALALKGIQPRLRLVPVLERQRSLVFLNCFRRVQYSSETA